MKALEEKYLEGLSELFPSIAAASTEIINLQAIVNLPKGTEHFLTDIHGEYEAFAHVLKNGSGSVKRKVDDVFANTMSSRDKQTLATLIYYPREKMERIREEEQNMDDWYKIMLYRLIEVAKRSASKYTRSKVRKALPKDFAYVIEELITEKSGMTDKESYYNSIISTIIQIGRAEEFIVALCELIQRLVVDHLHIVGDIYDRGPGPHLIMDKLMEYHSVDIQWGNHDILWMGAAAGQKCCIANVIRICARYGNLDILEDGYGINLLPLATFAWKQYAKDPCECFLLKGQDNCKPQEMELNMKMHKAISVIQFKVEGQAAELYPEFGFQRRNFLDKINYEEGTITIGGKIYQLLDDYFPTIDPKNPYQLSAEEEEIMNRLVKAFQSCEKLQRHMRFLLNKGSLYKIYNSNLTYLQVRLVQESCEVVYCRRTGDERSVIAAAVREAVKTADFVVTTGGVSVGQKDQLPYVMEELGARILFRGISLKPGMPSMGAVLEKTPVLCLSGNPYSAFAVFELLIRPLKAGFLGCTEYHYTRVQTIAASGFSKPSKTRRLLRGCYDGRSVSLSGKQQNGQLTGGIGCNCLVDIPADSEAVQSGDVVEIILTGQQ